MSYAKLHYTITDFAAGFQSVNQLRDNFQALYDAWSVEHSTRDGATTLALSFGRHNTPKVPRAVVKTSLFTGAANVVFPGAIEVQPVVTGISRISTGLFFIGVTDLLEFYAVTEPTTEPGKSPRMVIPRTYIAGRGAPSGIMIECYEKTTGFALTDFDFSATIYGTTP